MVKTGPGAEWKNFTPRLSRFQLLFLVNAASGIPLFRRNPICRGSSKPRFLNNQRLRPGKIQQLHIRALLHSLEDNFTPIWRDVEVADVKVSSEVGQLPLGPSL